MFYRLIELGTSFYVGHRFDSGLILLDPKEKISTGCVQITWTYHSRVLGLDQRPVGVVHLVVEAASIAQVVAVVVPAP